MRFSQLVPVAPIAVLVATAALAGCSGSSGGPAPSSPAGSPTAGTSAIGKPADARTRAAIQQAYTALFGTTATLAESVAALQHGDAFRQVILAESKNPRAKSSGAQVTAVTLQRPGLADVHFAVTENGKPIFPTVGKALLVHGHWQVAAQTFCGLLQLNGDAPQACHDPSVTALPH